MTLSPLDSEIEKYYLIQSVCGLNSQQDVYKGQFSTYTGEEGYLIQNF